MSTVPITVLLIEDNPGDVRLIEEMLAGTVSLSTTLITAGRLLEGLRYLDSNNPSVILLDLGLPDSSGLETLLRARDAVSDVPIVVLTGQDNEQVGIQAVQAGAQDYLVKGQVDGHLLERSIRYAFERHRLQTELRRAVEQQQQEQEFNSLEQLSGPPRASVTAEFFGSRPLREAAPGSFDELVGRYNTLLDLALEERAYRVEHNITEQLLAISEDLGHLRAGPRDVVDMHKIAVKLKTEEANYQMRQAYLDEGRLLVLELMGYLVLFYRNRSLGT